MRTHRYVMLLPLAAMLLGSDKAQSRKAALRPTIVKAQASKRQLPITFCRGDRKVTGQVLPGDLSANEVVLSAFGRVWTPPAEVRPSGANSLADFDVPTVRVPMVFSITLPNAGQLELGQLVAYPDRDVGWGKKIVLQAPGTPKWFNQWARAVGLPVRWLEESKNLANMATAKEDEKSLLILGKSSAGESLGQLLAAYSKHDCNLLVLEAKWFGTPAGPVAVRARHMHAGLAEIGKQSWAKSLAFSFHRNPLGGIVNRWPWTDGPDGPLVEQVQRSTLGLLAQQHCPVVLSYLPWQCQLGRNDLADQMLLALLEASARAKGAELASAIGWVWPERIEPEDRPVLTRACNPQSHKRGHVFVLDVRGDGFPADHQWKGGQAWEQTKMLILGDDKRLDESKWLKLDRAKKIAHRPGVVWLSDDELPPSRKNQIRLMHELTQLGVPLARPGQEE